MNERNHVDQSSADDQPARETGAGLTISAAIAMVSYLEAEIQPRNPIAAYFLARCRSSLLQDSLNGRYLNAKQVAARVPVKSIEQCEQFPKAGSTARTLQYLSEHILRAD